MHKLSMPDNAEGAPFYDAILPQIGSLIEGEPDLIANTANVASLLYHALRDVNWVGFYFVRGEDLVLGPFQGKPACVRVPLGKGVCGTAAAEGRTIVVPDVDAFPGHIACDALSKSEIVVPIVVGEQVLGVLDVDSPISSRFEQDDLNGLERIVALIVEQYAAMNLR